MDAYSTKKRQEDGILSMALNAPNRVQQRSLSASKLEGLKQESEMAKQWHKKAADDFILTTSNCRGLQKDTKESRVWGGPDYRIPGIGPSNAKTVRLGAGIWRQRSETDLKGTWNFLSANSH
eukprot:TRINITY_DN18646_c0_g2_i2.p1 TRINITY_DN18646_c0_g2~~TRINITY_DN18646_c0_g2_i2.p1  ORF type:complete len:122 (+),score=24.08 TRINITY_DN18646_c0_g2_i2:77-442(+)